jgi:hypothetical protein
MSHISPYGPNPVARLTFGHKKVAMSKIAGSVIIEVGAPPEISARPRATHGRNSEIALRKMNAECTSKASGWEDVT